MRNAMYPSLETMIVSNTPTAPAFPIAMLGLQITGVEGNRCGRRSQDAIEVWQMAALWSDDRTSCDAALWSDDVRSCDAALWADHWPIAT